MTELARVLASKEKAYHGTSKKFKELKIGKHSGTGAGSLYGDAIYFTSDQDTAKSFAGNGPNAKVYVLDDMEKLNLFDCNNTKFKKISLEILKKLQEDFPGSYSLEYVTTRDLFQGMKDAMVFSNIKNGPNAGEAAKLIKNILVQMGYDGVRSKQSDGTFYYALYNPKVFKSLKVIKP